jgi:hypothetical protein
VEAYGGLQIVGMDLHQRRSVLVRMTLDGRRLGTSRIGNRAAELRKEIARYGHPKSAGLARVPGVTPFRRSCPRPLWRPLPHRSG